MDSNGYIMGTLPANVEGKPTIGLFLTWTQHLIIFSGTNVNP